MKFKQWSKVRFNTKINRIITPDMKKWIEDHCCSIFVVEQQVEQSVKLKGIGFWVTEDLLVEHDGREFTPENITFLKENEVFVFGSNEQGIHGRGAALTAKQLFNAQQGKGIGMTGDSYALPTCTWINKALVPLNLNKIQEYANQFIDYAKNNSNKKFYLTKVGCNLAGYTPEQIAPLFAESINVKNIIIPMEFYDVIKGN